MNAYWLAAGCAALALSACGGGGDTAAPEEKAGPVDLLLPGEYEITTIVTQLDSSDGSTPATSATLDTSRTHTVCVGEDGLLPPETFGEDGDTCTIENPYFRRGKIRQQLACQREANAGQIQLQVDAEFTAEGVDGTVKSGTYFAGDGDYSMTRSLSGKRVGDCTLAEAAEELEGTKIEE
ncbi:DUF3617 domain-containing protein [Sphingomicrobium nitratireducens]|uniref:DUF3617 domain-containing protein n=1 Tax=Sphingomicrobium nitratireducens TaxID=2964666 RepID=UPI002240C638|nr:DUF3617 family protein [Sphingomicrobium nitratireducens]